MLLQVGVDQTSVAASEELDASSSRTTQPGAKVRNSEISIKHVRFMRRRKSRMQDWWLWLPIMLQEAASQQSSTASETSKSFSSPATQSGTEVRLCILFDTYAFCDDGSGIVCNTYPFCCSHRLVRKAIQPQGSQVPPLQGQLSLEQRWETVSFRLNTSGLCDEESLACKTDDY